MKKGDQLELEISDLAFGGKAISKVKTPEGDFVFFIENAIPGQRVLAQILKKKKSYAECKLLKILKVSPFEVTVPYQPISGSPYLALPIDKQIEYKKNTVFELFKRLGAIPQPEKIFDEFIVSPRQWHYRNKMEYSFSSIRHDIHTDKEHDDFALGFKHRGTWWKVENLDKSSGLFDEAFENHLHDIRAYCQTTGLPAWHPPKKTGFFRHLVVRKSFSEDRLLINLITSSENHKKFNAEEFLNVLQKILGKRLAGFQYTINDNVADRQKIENGSTKLIYGKAIITEEILGLKFEISMESFFQTNPACAEKLYAKTIDYVLENNPLNNDVVMDLFCGTGTIGQILAKKVPDLNVIGVDIVKEAIDNAKRNAALNQIKKLKFFASDVGKFLLEYPQYQNKISTIVIDPPRAGITPKTLRKILRLNAKRIVYVSCNPATQARDLIAMREFGYHPIKFSLVGQFPHTAHVESVFLLEKSIS